ncbi:YidB family protein [Streptomyces sp. 142MFCol3.1]|uniref:YidB family protein n=1 Tax=Streptomyces sp. 142MFCol3.1 TaxID=1172179 RepID=UPI000565E131|nr:YidB family protein [Streptomyces sp. 142MFCol3.1]
MAGNDLGSLLGGLLGDSGQSGAAGAPGAGDILGALLGALSGGSGAASGNPLGGLLDMLTKAGLAEQKDSWVGTGENQSVTGAQIQHALPDDALKQIADEAGITTDQAATQIAENLPRAVDKLTPQGQMPAGSLEDLIRAQNL